MSNCQYQNSIKCIFKDALFSTGRGAKKAMSVLKARFMVGSWLHAGNQSLHSSFVLSFIKKKEKFYNSWIIFLLKRGAHVFTLRVFFYNYWGMSINSVISSSKGGYESTLAKGTKSRKPFWCNFRCSLAVNNFWSMQFVSNVYQHYFCCI